MSSKCLVLPDGPATRGAGVCTPFYWLRLAPSRWSAGNFIPTNGRLSEAVESHEVTAPRVAGPSGRTHAFEKLLAFVLDEEVWIFLLQCLNLGAVADQDVWVQRIVQRVVLVIFLATVKAFQRRYFCDDL